jgi:hypothetical protein
LRTEFLNQLGTDRAVQSELQQHEQWWSDRLEDYHNRGIPAPLEEFDTHQSLVHDVNKANEVVMQIRNCLSKLP